MSQELNNQMLERSGVSKLHSLGFKGQGLKCWCAENLGSEDQHEVSTVQCVLASAPLATVTAVQNQTGIFVQAKAQGIHIVNVSMEDISDVGLNEYLAWGGVVVVAVGNNYSSPLNRDTRYISVGATTLSDFIPAWSAKTEALDLVTYTPYLKRTDGTYFQRNGTSFHAPYATGIIMCLIGYWKSIGFKYNQDILEQYLKNNAIDLLEEGKDISSGYGRMKVGLMKKIELEIGGKAFINGVQVPIDAPAQIVNGRTLAPVRFLAENMGGTLQVTQQPGMPVTKVTIFQEE